MTGTIFDEIKKKGDQKKKEKLKQITAIISTNVLVATVCLSFFKKQPEAAIIASKIKTAHNHYKAVVIPLTVLVDQNATEDEIAVSILNKNKKLIIQKAYLHEEVKTPNKELGGATYFKIEIPEEDILKIGASGEDLMIAVPELKMISSTNEHHNKRVSPYEINL